MELRREEVYQIGGEMYRTEQSALYYAADREGMGLPYLVKKYIGGDFGKETLYREMHITQEVEKYAEKSVVIPIVQVLEEEGNYFELLQFRKNGEFLQNVIDRLEERYGRGKIPLRDILAIIREIFVSLEAMHKFKQNGDETGYLHLDLHPGNIFLESVDYERITAGRAKFIDFLTARRMQGGKPVEDGKYIRAVTNGYAAPELLKEPEGEVGVWTDIYAICSVFYRMYTGRNYYPDCYEQYTDPAHWKDVEEESVLKIIQSVGNERGDNPVMAYLTALFLACGLEKNTGSRFQEVGECLEMLDLMEQCRMACGQRRITGDKKEVPGTTGDFQKPDYTKMLDIAYKMRAPAWIITPDWIVFDAERFNNAVETLGSRDAHNGDTKKNYYCFRVLWKLYQENYKKTYKETRYHLLHVGINICNHYGDDKLAIKIYDAFEENRKNIPILEYIKIRNTVTGTLQRMFFYSRSMKILEENILRLAGIYDVYQRAASSMGLEGGDDVLVKTYGRAVGTYGKHLAAMEELGIPVQKTEGLPAGPLEAFRRAHEIFGLPAGKKGDWARTAMLILHYAIWKKDRELFERYAPGIFGKMNQQRYCVPVDVNGVDKTKRKGFFGGHSSILDCYEDILANQELRYTMHLFLKGIYCFYMDQVDDRFFLQLLQFSREPRVMKDNNMPIELVYRYCGCILWEKARQMSEESARRTDGCREERLSPEELRREALHVWSLAVFEKGIAIDEEMNLNIRMCMAYQTQAIAYVREGKQKELSRLREKLLQHAEASGWKELVEAVQSGRSLENLLIMENC